jgi:hypothetical protein
MGDIAAGMYRDPENPGRLRYWDGEKWAPPGILPPPDLSSAATLPPPTTAESAYPAAAPGLEGYAPPDGPVYPLAPPSTGRRALNQLALWSMICSLAFWIVCGLGWVVGPILGFIALSQIKHSSTPQEGKGFAIAGIVVGLVFLALTILILVTGNVTHCSTIGGATTCQG